MNLQNLNLAIYISPLCFFVTISIFLFIFVFWTEAKRDGFDKYRLFDIIFSLSILSVLLFIALSRFIYTLQVFHYDSVLLKTSPYLIQFSAVYVLWLVGIWSFTVYNNWSFYRLLDTFTVSLTVMFLPLAIYVLLLTKNSAVLWLYLPYLISYKLIFSKRGSYGFVSGFGFVLLNFINAITVLFVPGVTGKLPIAVLFFTITVLVVYFRKGITVSKTNLTKGFLDFIKKQLLSKDQELNRQEQSIKKDDPFMRLGRTEDNAEDLEEAMMEDNKKEVNDARLSIIKSIHVQVKRALAFLKMGKYGICEICGKSIDPARLKAYPEATTCIEHASRSNR